MTDEHGNGPRLTSCSVIVPTRNRCESLSETLTALARVDVPAGWRVELIVVDNGSSDASSAVAARGSIGNVSARVLAELRPGVSRARNRGAGGSSGDVLLFLDDDMRPPPNWLDALAGPIVAGEADATVSQFRAGAGRDRPWLKDDERALFITEHSVDNDHPFLVGGSMAISRAAYDFCGGFDERLGPGVLGAGGEDLLMTYQLENAGYRIASVAQVVTEHWFDEAKLTRLGVRERRVASAMSEVWLAYHWFGRSDALERPKLVLLGVQGRVLRVLRSWGISR